MSTWIVEYGMVPLLVPEVFPPVDFSMQAHVYFVVPFAATYIIHAPHGGRCTNMRVVGEDIRVTSVP